MTLNHGDPTYGTVLIQSLDYTQRHGTYPDSALIHAVPGVGNLPGAGTLRVTYNSVDIQIPLCKTDWATATYRPDGHLLTVSVLDRRWRWQAGGEINGVWNVRTPQGVLIPDTVKTPRELAAMLLEAMHEPVYDVSQIPDDSRPEINWEAAHPATELSKLCDYLGCRVVLGANAEPVRIWRLGSGPGAPVDLTIATVTYGIDPPEMPDSLKVKMSHTTYDWRLALEAVGLDNDGTVVPIDDLSYKPAGGWEPEAAGNFEGIADPEDRRLAQETVYHWYQVTGLADGATELPEYGELEKISQIFPLNQYRMVHYYASGQDLIVRQPMEVRGTYWLEAAGDDVDPLEVSEDMELYPGGFTLKPEEGIVVFNRPVYSVDATGNLPATLYLSTSFQVKDTASRQLLYATYEQALGQAAGTGPKIIDAEHLRRILIAEYDEGSDTPASVTDNEADMVAEAQKIITSVLPSYQTRNSYVVGYNVLKDVRPTGVIQQVNWKVHYRRGTTTQVSVNSEVDEYAWTYAETRAIEDRRHTGRMARRLLRELSLRRGILNR